MAPSLQLAVVGASAASLVQATSTETSSASVPEISTVAQTLVPSPFEHAPKSPTPDVIDSTIGCFGGTIVDGTVVDGVVTTAPMGSRPNSTPPNTTGSGPSPTDTALSHTSTLNNGPSNKPPSSPSRLDHPDSYPTAAPPCRPRSVGEVGGVVCGRVRWPARVLHRHAVDAGTPARFGGSVGDRCARLLRSRPRCRPVRDPCHALRHRAEKLAERHAL